MTTTVTRAEKRAQKRAARLADPDRVGLGTLLAWSTTGVSGASAIIVLSFVGIYATDTLQMPAALVGTLGLVSKLFEAVTVAIAGIIVDRTPETRWGKARPYELSIVGVWAATWLLFSVPDLGLVGKAIWLLASMIFVNAVFVTLLGANDTLYTARAFGTRLSIARIATRSGLLTVVGAMATSITFPMFMAQVGKSPAGWSQIVLWYAIPMAFLGLGRFVFCREKFDVEDPASPKVTLSDVREMLKANKYVWIIAVTQLLSAAMLGIGVAAYYYTYIVGDVGLMGLMGLVGVLAMITMLAFPLLMRRLPVSTIISLGAALGIVGAAIMLFAGANLLLIGLSSFLTGVAILPITFLSQLLIIDNASYNEWKGHRRLESTMGSLGSFMNRLGAGAAGAVAGWTLTLSGYDGTAASQSPSAIMAIVGLSSVFPIVLYVLIIVLMRRYRPFEAELPRMQHELAERHAAKGLNDPLIDVFHIPHNPDADTH